MKTRAEILKSKGYWIAKLQTELFRIIDSYMVSKHMNKTQLAEHLGCTKGYVSQLLNGDFDHKMSKFIELSLAVGKIPEIIFHDIDQYIESEPKSYHSRTSLSIMEAIKEPIYYDEAA
ncbi:hypothetical protein [Phocaeicola paurosaccharolyticus]|uniref:hypothetical protein n=1 Tax=Phocaeicola paurosaccharolyticus TaxID=732242 RepID=UPI00046A2A50|nr:hypothetical protein [Phocaeicola paurosaccharolyticus]